MTITRKMILPVAIAGLFVSSCEGGAGGGAVSATRTSSDAVTTTAHTFALRGSFAQQSEPWASSFQIVAHVSNSNGAPSGGLFLGIPGGQFSCIQRQFDSFSATVYTTTSAASLQGTANCSNATQRNFPVPLSLSLTVDSSSGAESGTLTLTDPSTNQTTSFSIVNITNVVSIQ